MPVSAMSFYKYVFFFPILVDEVSVLVYLYHNVRHHIVLLQCVPNYTCRCPFN